MVLHNKDCSCVNNDDSKTALVKYLGQHSMAARGQESHATSTKFTGQYSSAAHGAGAGAGMTKYSGQFSSGAGGAAAMGKYSGTGHGVETSSGMAKYSGQYSSTNYAATTESGYGSGRLAEKQELVELNSRLHHYIRRIREMKEGQGFEDSKTFIHSVTQLEEELVTLKTSYEQELDRTRIQVDDVSRAKTHFEREEKKARTLIIELKNRLDVETQRTNSYSVEISAMQRVISQKDMMIEEGRIAMQKPMTDLEELNIQYQKIRREYNCLEERFEQEQLARQDAESKIDSERKKWEFQFAQEKKEMHIRLQSSNSTILALQEKTQKTSHHDTTSELQRVREIAEIELRKYQKESEERHNRNLTELKAQIDEDDRRITEITEESLRLNDQITILISQVKELEGHNNGLEHQKQSYMQMLEVEKRKTASHMKKMDIRLRELQEELVCKMRELNATRESQVSLKSEIESFRAIMEEEERRLRLSTGAGGGLPELSVSKSLTVASLSNGYGSKTGHSYSMRKSDGHVAFGGGQTTYGGGQSAFGGGHTAYGGGQSTFGGGQSAFGGGQTTFGGGKTTFGGGQTAFGGGQRSHTMIASKCGQSNGYFDGNYGDLKMSNTDAHRSGARKSPSPQLQSKLKETEAENERIRATLKHKEKELDELKKTCQCRGSRSDNRMKKKHVV